MKVTKYPLNVGLTLKDKEILEDMKERTGVSHFSSLVRLSIRKYEKELLRGKALTKGGFIREAYRDALRVIEDKLILILKELPATSSPRGTLAGLVAFLQDAVLPLTSGEIGGIFEVDERTVKANRIKVDEWVQDQGVLRREILT